MVASKVTISIEPHLLEQVDQLVQNRVFSNRSQAIQAAVQEKLARLHKTRLAQECANLDPQEEQEWADLGLASEAESWPRY